MHGTAMLMIRGGVAGPLRTQMVHCCQDAVEAIIAQAARSKGKVYSGPKWPANLILGEAARSKVTDGDADSDAKSANGKRSNSNSRPIVRLGKSRS
jgi:hypothetical protein